MAKCCSASVLTVVLLGCLVGIQIEAQRVHQSNIQGSLQTPGQPNKQVNVHEPVVKKTPQTQQSSSVQKQGWNQNPQTVVNTCDLRDNVRVVCGHPHISAQECEALNCCFDGHRCYYGKAVTLHCTKSGEFIIVVAKDVTVPLLDLETISLLGQGQGCSHIDSNSNFAIYQFPVTSCGTVVMEDSGSGSLIYENKMISSYEVGISRLGAITRDSQFELVVQCRYHPFLTSTSVQALIFDEVRESIHWHVNGTGSVSVELMLANGECTAKGCNDFEEAYTSFYTEYPVTKALREPVFVAVRLLGMHPTVHLTLGRCWATYGSSPHSLPQWDILINGCPYQDDRYLSKLIRIDSNSGLNFPNHHKRFMFQMFSFVNPQTLSHMSEQMYLHCSTYLCFPAQGYSCEPSCPGNSYRNRRNVDAVAQENTISRVATVGPLIFRNDEQ
ncbi:zona pellucida sperm-binding protein 4-like [Sphaeramia orbicularis]|uniref:zona pellucida sperm-binding protein 4-like n=1 Tax=Sphaeramia orbicularis TaxID=375764 RepID=UPI00117D1BB2|nr:zona pellucida sperm-binding protein 4-like [Sphaeramia orbicularis]